jgi:hypothetical protein
MAKRRGGRFKKMLGLGFNSFEKAFSRSGKTKEMAQCAKPCSLGILQSSIVFLSPSWT